MKHHLYVGVLVFERSTGPVEGVAAHSYYLAHAKQRHHLTQAAVTGLLQGAPPLHLQGTQHYIKDLLSEGVATK